jgi:hypothetical protein
MEFGTKSNDNWETPAQAFLDVRELIAGKVVWDPFYSQGRAAAFLMEAGAREVIHEQRDAFEWNPDCDIVCTNPPFSIKKRCLLYLLSLGKDVLILLPLVDVSSKWFREVVEDREYSMFLPNKRYAFLKDGIRQAGVAFPSVWFFFPKLPSGLHC